MTYSTRLPRFDDCVVLYLRAFDQYGTDTFVPCELDSFESDSERDRLLELAVAYGFFSTDGTTYTVNCTPDASDGDWTSLLVERADRISEAIPHQMTNCTGNSTPSPEEAVISYNRLSFTSIFMTNSTTFEEVAEAVASVSEDTSDGVVLRSAGDRANKVQRIADQFCDPTETDDLPFSTAFQKVHTAVKGDDTDELEFRLFLVST